MPVRVLLADDHPLVCRGIETILSSREGFEVVGSARDGREAVALARETRPDLILMDVGMPGCSGLEAVRQIKHEMPEVKIVMLTVSDEGDDLFGAIRSGAQGYLLKDVEPGQLVGMLRGVMRGEAPLSGVMAAKILEVFARHDLPARAPAEDAPSRAELAIPLEGTPEGLTEREVEVLKLVAVGKTNGEIAEALVIAINTVKNHVSSILSKLHLQNRIQLTAYAVRRQLVDEEESE